MHSMTLVNIVSLDSLVFDELHIVFLLLLLGVLDAGKTTGQRQSCSYPEEPYVGAMVTCVEPDVAVRMWVISSVLNAQLIKGSPSSVGPRFSA